MLLVQQSQTLGFFDPIAEIIRNLFRFSFGETNVDNAKDFRQILQALNYRGDNPSSRNPGPSKCRGVESKCTALDCGLSRWIWVVVCRREVVMGGESRLFFSRRAVPASGQRSRGNDLLDTCVLRY